MIMDTIEFCIVAVVITTYPARLDYFFFAVILTKVINTLICNYAVFYELKNDLGPWLKSTISTIQSDLKSFYRFTIEHSFSNTLKTLMNQGDVLLLNAFCGATQVGYYTVAKKLAYSVLTVTDPLVASIFPQLSVLMASRQFTEAKQMVYRITRFASGPLLLVTLIAFFFKSAIITTLYGKDFAGAGNPFFIHLLGAIQGSIFFWILPLVQSLGMTAMRLRIYILAIISGTLISLFLMPYIQATGVAVGLLVANLIITSSFLYFALRRMNMEQKLV
jgi:O-antigen/teichoic acid export membrane protein